MSNHSLVLVGSGIKFLSHLTIESKSYIESASKVLYLVNEPAMQTWIKKNNKNSESLDDLYSQFTVRQDAYKAITNYILETLKVESELSVVLYGHPTVFARPGLDAIKRASDLGYRTQILPGISALDCLFADLKIDLGCGFQSFDATDFIIYHRKFDVNSNLFLWQVNSVGVFEKINIENECKNINVLMEYLLKFYLDEHLIYLYQASQYPFLKPEIKKIPLSKLNLITISSTSMLYIPPLEKSMCDRNILLQFNTSI